MIYVQKKYIFLDPAIYICDEFWTCCSIIHEMYFVRFFGGRSTWAGSISRWHWLHRQSTRICHFLLTLYCYQNVWCRFLSKGQWPHLYHLHYSWILFNAWSEANSCRICTYRDDWNECSGKIILNYDQEDVCLLRNDNIQS